MNFALLDFGSSVPLFITGAIGIAFVFYIIFAFVILKQVNKMTDTLEVGFEGVLRTLAILHLLFAVLAFIATLVIL